MRQRESLGRESRQDPRCTAPKADDHASQPVSAKEETRLLDLVHEAMADRFSREIAAG